MFGNEISIMEAINITISSMTIVFLTLILISLVLSSFKYIFKAKSQVKTVIKKEVEKEQIAFDEDDEEDRVVVALAASIMAGGGKINPNLHVKRITRIK